MEKMNQVSVSEFFAKSKEEMYDMAVEMVEKYNRLIDICNDSSERIAELVIERDNLSKGVQKLIGEREDLIERHNAYTSALNKDLADKAAKIELMEKEIEGRKKGYYALKEKMDDIKDELDDTKMELEAVTKARDIWFETTDGLHKNIKELKETIKTKDEEITKCCKDIISQSGTICNLKKELDRVKASKENWFDTANAYARTVSELNNEKEKLEKQVKNLEKEEDDHGRKGFKEYIKWIVKEEEAKYKESWKARLNEELATIFKEEEETEVKGRYPWGTKKNDIPCGSDSIE